VLEFARLGTRLPQPCPQAKLPEDEIVLKEETQRNAPNLTGSREPALGAAGEGDLRVMSGLLPISRVTG